MVWLAAPAQAQTQEPAPPPSPWKLNFGGGFALTSGNKDTSTYNASYAVSYAPHTRSTFKSEAFLIRGKTNDELSSDRFGLTVREEVRVNEHVFAFGQGQYSRDRFKRIQYLVAPTAGVGVTLASTETTTLTVDAGAGGVWEKNPYADARASGALTLTQKLTQTISSTTTLNQSLTGLWKTEDLSDAYYQLAVSAALGVNSHIQFKIEAIDTYNMKPTGSGVQKNDVSMVFALVFRR
jgi:putative salt-induced outer membrane protein YdiY